MSDHEAGGSSSLQQVDETLFFERVHGDLFLSWKNWMKRLSLSGENTLDCTIVGEAGAALEEEIRELKYLFSSSGQFGLIFEHGDGLFKFSGDNS